MLGLYNCRFRETQQALLAQLEELGKPLTVVLLGAPYDAAHVRNADALLCSFEYTPLSTLTMAEALAEGTYRGKMPVKL